MAKTTESFKAIQHFTARSGRKVLGLADGPWDTSGHPGMSSADMISLLVRPLVDLQTQGPNHPEPCIMAPEPCVVCSKTLNGWPWIPPVQALGVGIAEGHNPEVHPPSPIQTLSGPAAVRGHAQQPRSYVRYMGYRHPPWMASTSTRVRQLPTGAETIPDSGYWS